MLQKLFADSCIKIGHFDEALEVFKYLLYINPKDQELQLHVSTLENELVIKDREISQTQILKEPASFDDDNWVQVDFVQTEKDKNVELNERPKFSLSEPVVQRSLDDDYFIDEEYEVENETTKPAETPLLSHTLVDLYISQNYFDKAHELLKQYAKIFPNDLKIMKKLSDVESKMNMSSEELGYAELMSQVEKTQELAPDINSQLSFAYSEFLKLIKQKSAEKKASWLEY
jgi:tetratricopeptide (TPR) repeat protein